MADPARRWPPDGIFKPNPENPPEIEKYRHIVSVVNEWRKRERRRAEKAERQVLRLRAALEKYRHCRHSMTPCGCTLDAERALSAQRPPPGEGGSPGPQAAATTNKED